MSKKPTSERLQLQRFKETYPAEFEEQNYCIVLFVDELRYSVLERKNIDDPAAQVMSTVAVKEGGKKYTATLVFVGSKDNCDKRMEALVAIGSSSALEDAQSNKRIGANPGESKKRHESIVGRDIEMEMKKVEKLATARHIKPLDSSSDDDDNENISVIKTQNKAKPAPFDDYTWRENIQSTLDRILRKVEAIEKELKSGSACYTGEGVVNSTPPNRKKVKLSEDVGESSGLSPSATPSLIFNGTDLLSLPSGGDCKKYALKIFSHLFTTEEMAGGIVEPSRGKATGKAELATERVELLKRAIREKFGENTLNRKWSLIRQSLNQKCLDSKNKKMKFNVINDSETNQNNME